MAFSGLSVVTGPSAAHKARVGHLSCHDSGRRGQRIYQGKRREWGVVGNSGGARWGFTAAVRLDRASIEPQIGIDGCAHRPGLGENRGKETGQPVATPRVKGRR